MKRAICRSSGITLLEVLLSVTILSILFVATYMIQLNVLGIGRIDAAARTGETLARKAMYLASAVQDDSPWGIRFESANVTLFKGDSFEDRNTQYDEQFELSNLILSGELEYIFNKVTGLPREPGTVTFSDENGVEVRQLTINEMGQITIE